MLILERPKIEQRIDLAQLAPLMEQAYRDYSNNQINQPPVGHIAFPENGGDCHIKYGQRRGDSLFVVKVATGFPAYEPDSTPSGNGLSLVLSARDGRVIALLHDQMEMTNQRTALGGAIASRALANPDADRLLIVGTGVQSRAQIEAHAMLMDRPLTIELWGRDLAKAETLAQRFAADDQIVGVTDDLARAVSRAQIIVTTTAAVQPVVMQQWVTPGTHITAVGADAPGKQELEPLLLQTADLLVADSRTQCLDHGELEALHLAPDSVPELGEVLNGDHPGRTSEQQISIVDLTGLACQDIAIAKHVLRDELSTID